MTPRERLREKLMGARHSSKVGEARALDEFMDALDDYLDSKKGQTLRDRLMTAVGVVYAEVRTAGTGPSLREEALEHILNDGWVMDRIAGILERT